jgi:hypothetical protein
MATRACYRFIPENSSKKVRVITVYKHYDGYPSGAADAITNALPHAWPLHRFEPDEFAAAFIAGNKMGPGGVYLVPSGGAKAYRAYDAAYLYDITCRKGELLIAAYTADDERKLFEGSLDALRQFRDEQ